jgi:YVTN family beta-propeller protein
VITNITAGVAPLYLVYDSGKSEIFVSDEGSTGNTISVISDSSNQVVATVNGGPAPEGLAYDPAKGEIFIANYNAGSFSIISDSTNALVMTKQLGTYAGDPTDVTYDSGKGVAFLTCGDGVVYVISDSNNTAFAYAPLVQFPVSQDSFGPLPDGITYDSTKGELYVADSGSNAVSNISDAFIISGSTPSVSTPSAPQDLTVKPRTNEVTLSWSAPANDGGANILSYSIYRSLAGSAYSQIGNVSAGTLSYVDNTGSAGNNYSYYVVALNSAGSGTQTVAQNGNPITPSTPSSSTSGDSYIIIGVVALIVVIGIVLFFMHGRRKSGPEEKTGNANRSVTPSNGASSENGKGGISPVIESKGASTDSNVMEQESTNQSKPAQSLDTQTIRQSQGPIGPQSERAERFRRLVSVFQQKGATSPEKAMTAQELGLPPRFEEYMDSRSGQTRIFVEINGKYYLDQKALEEMRQRMDSRKSSKP